MKIAIIVIILTLISACGAGKFVVKQSDARFSENKNLVYTSENNRISSKSIAGGFHIDGNGVYINPFIEKDVSSNKVTLAGFNIINKTDYTTMAGGVNQLGSIRKVVFRFTDGTLISKNVLNQDNISADTISYNSVGKYASYDKWETGVILLDKTELLKLARAASISCKITGSKRSVVYEENDISKTFLSNLNKFYQEYMQ